MFVSFIRYIRGYVKVRVIGYSPERFINLCKNKKISIWGMHSKGNTYEMFLPVRGFKKIKPLLKKTKTKVIIEGKYGVPFWLFRYRKRKILLLGSFVACLIVYIMSLFVWNIEIKGNQSITDEVILEYLETIKIQHGMMMQNIDCNETAQKIRRNFDQVIWVSVSKEGTRLLVHIKENDSTHDVSPSIQEPANIVATEDGIITEIITRSGVPCVKKGDEVKKGDILVSGTIDILNDAKEVTSHKQVKADGDIVIETVKQYEDSISSIYYERKYTNKKRTIRYIRLWNYTLHIGIQKNKFEKQEQTSEETQLRIGDSFYLPFYWGNKKIKEYKLIKKEYDQETMETLLKDRVENYCEKYNTLECNVEYIKTSNGMKATGTIKVQEEHAWEWKNIDLSTTPVIE